MELNEQQFLPGTEHMRPAEPHEQTERQFHNRPDVMVHARFMNVADVNAPGAHAQMGKWESSSGFHAGTEQAAYERMEALGPPNVASDPHPRYFHGRVDPSRMKNGPVEDQGRLHDQGEDWTHDHHNSYYLNVIEDKGSVSTVHGWRDPERVVDTLGSSRHVSIPDNFTTWRQSVTQANDEGTKVPSHVQALYDATGGSAGPHHVLHPDLDRHLNDAWKNPENKRVPLSAQDAPMFSPMHHTSSKRWQPNLGSFDKSMDLG